MSSALKCLVLWLLMAAPAQAVTFLIADRLTLEVWDYKFYRDPYYPYTTNNGGEQWAYGAGLNFDFTILAVQNFELYSRNWLHLGATDKQVREAGWQWDQGLRLYNKVELFYGHHSRHILDEAPDPNIGRYPVYDMYGMRLLIYERSRK